VHKLHHGTYMRWANPHNILLPQIKNLFEEVFGVGNITILGLDMKHEVALGNINSKRAGPSQGLELEFRERGGGCHRDCDLGRLWE
jgi:hypothetical protein